MELESENQVHVSNANQQNGGTNFFKTCFNVLNTLIGIGILSTSYAVYQGGWLSFLLLIMFGMICCYTALLLDRCMNANPEIKSYADLGEVTFGYKGRAVIGIFIYLEAFLICVELLILEADNLEKLFPNMRFTVFGLRIGGKSGFVFLTALAILPTTWLRNLGALAYISVGGVLTSVILIACVMWVGEVDGVGFHERGHVIHWTGLSTSMSIFAFCFSAHSLMPTICTSMRDRKQFSKVMFWTNWCNSWLVLKLTLDRHVALYCAAGILECSICFAGKMMVIVHSHVKARSKNVCQFFLFLFSIQKM
ncbi:amino acid transporter AVT1I-like [Vicia villosa]|uniref:amino acid transporter AVT1I-like n=1 Tax=Vicia villosa TaxID=3911 RepID=UPI00273CCC65|nr:amino acid transporter AVT1I-like [Vicia villosa]